MLYKAAKYLCIALALAPGDSVLAHRTPPCERVISERMLRKSVVSMVEPIYPNQSIRDKHQGVAIAMVCITPGSNQATSINIVMSPDRAIAEAMKTALSRWRFSPVFDRRDEREIPFSAGAKITYYFANQEGRWVVLDPMRSFYLGPTFALAR